MIPESSSGACGFGKIVEFGQDDFSRLADSGIVVEPSARVEGRVHSQWEQWEYVGHCS